MCGIAAISFSPESTVNRRRLAGLLLEALEMRGRDAAGYAWVDPTGDGYYKKNVRGSKLSTAKIPQDAQALILHTRASTHGSPLQNENNHPVLSPSGQIRLVHNGVVYNHAEVRSLLGAVGETLPEVDTSVIPAVIEALGIENTDLMEGDAACAWLDQSTGRTLHVAKFQHSPVATATLIDGTFVMASTPDILAYALQSMDLEWFGYYPTPFYEFNDGEYIQIEDGYIVHEGTAEWGEDYYSSFTNSYRSVTSGATTMGTPSEDKEEYWNQTDRPMAMSDEWGYDGASFRMDAEDDEDFHHVELGTKRGFSNVRALYYTMSHDGDYVTYTNIDALRASMRWHAGLKPSPEFFTADTDDPSIMWINHISDLGQVVEDGSAVESWVKNPHLFEDFREEVGPGIRDGVDRLRTLIGA